MSDIPEQPDSADIVRLFLRAQNLEQVGHVEAAVELYEVAVGAQFDSSGPYDRLIDVYTRGALHREVVRVARAALDHVRTHPEKHKWYERTAEEAERAAAKVPTPAPRSDPTL